MQFAFFLFFVVSVLILGSVTVGTYSIRVYMTVLMLMYLIAFKKPVKERTLGIRRDYIYYFLVCILFLSISLIINGGLLIYGFVDRCIAYYLVCVVAYFAVDFFVKKEVHFDKLVFVLSLIVLFDSAVTILQFQNNPIGWGLGAIFSDVEDFADFLNDHDSFVGVSKLPGIFGHPVNNGFFLAVVAPMLLTGIGKNKSKLKSLLYIGAISLTIMALFFLQQRAAFFLVILVVAYHFLKEFVKKTSRFILPIAVVILLIILFAPSNTEEVELGRLATSENNSRTRVWLWALSVFLDNPLFGNIVGYYKEAEYSAHNALIDSLINSGIFGFIPLCILYIKTAFDSLRIARNNNYRYARIFSYSVLICLAMGMFHNTSYMTGDVIIFISLALMFKAQVLSIKLDVK